MATMQPLVSSFPGIAGSLPVMPLPLWVNNRTVLTFTDEMVPAGAAFVVINPDADVWIAAGPGASAAPTTDVTNGTGSVFFKGGVISPPFRVQPGQILSTTGAAHVAYWYYGSLSTL